MNEYLMLAAVSGEQVLNAFVYLIIWGLIVWVLHWALGKIAPGEPWMKIANVALVLLTVVIVVNVLLSFIGKQFIKF